MKKRPLAILAILFGVLIVSLVIKILDRIPLMEDATISGQILGEFESASGTNSTLNRTITRHQETPNWGDNHLEIGTLSRREFTLIRITGILDETEKNVLKSVAMKLEREHKRHVELEFKIPVT